MQFSALFRLIRNFHYIQIDMSKQLKVKHQYSIHFQMKSLALQTSFMRSFLLKLFWCYETQCYKKRDAKRFLKKARFFLAEISKTILVL